MDLERLQEIIGYTFKNNLLLARALLSKARSASFIELALHNLDPSEVEELREGYEELEFLGDRVLNLLIGEVLFEEKGMSLEEKAQAYAFLRSDNFLKKVGAFLEEFIVASEEQRKHAVPDVVEALLGAVYLDCGREMEAPRRVFERTLLSEVEEALKNKEHVLLFAKAKLFEYASKNKLTHPIFEVVETSPSSQDPYFKVRCSFEGRETFGEGRTKKEAEAKASLEMLRELERGGNDAVSSMS